MAWGDASTVVPARLGYGRQQRMSKASRPFRGRPMSRSATLDLMDCSHLGRPRDARPLFAPELVTGLGLLDGRPAPYDSPTIMVGGTESYEARCRACHQVPRRDEGQGRLL